MAVTSMVTFDTDMVGGDGGMGMGIGMAMAMGATMAKESDGLGHRMKGYGAEWGGF